MATAHAIKPCRFCKGKNYHDVLNMGQNPLVNSLISREELGHKETTYPLKVVRCNDCSLVQIAKPIDAHKIYKEVDYLYFSSDMPGLSDYFKEYATDLKDRFLSEGDLVVEIGSNDGIMLEHFIDKCVVFGVDPATNVVLRALKKGVPTLPLFFNKRVAEQIAFEWGNARVMYGNNCIAHIDNLDEVMEGVKALLTDDGVFVVECNYWGGMVKNKNYALVYHDHFSYFSLKNWADIANKYGMQVFDAVVTPAQGGSLRVFMGKGPVTMTARCLDLIKEEVTTKLNTKEVAEQYGRDCLEEAKKLRYKVEELKGEGKVIAGYGAAAKGFSVLKLAGIDQRHLSFFVDDSPAKQGKYTPISHIPIVARTERKDPDVFFITAPNYAETIMKKEKDFKGQWLLCDSTVI